MKDYKKIVKNDQKYMQKLFVQKEPDEHRK